MTRPIYRLFNTSCYAQGYNGNDTSTDMLFTFPAYGRKLKLPCSPADGGTGQIPSKVWIDFNFAR